MMLDDGAGAGAPMSTTESSSRRSDTIPSAEDLLRLLDAYTSTVIYIRRISPPRLVFLNAAYEQMWGRPRQEALDDYTAWTRSIHPDDLPHVLSRMERSWSGPEAHDMEFRLVRPDGTVRWLHNRTVIGHLDQAYAVGVAEDVTERHRSRDMLAAQHEVLESVAHGDSLKRTFDLLCAAIERLAPDTRASILLLDSDGESIRHAAAPRLPQPYIDVIDGEKIGPSAGSCGTAMHNREMVIVEDISTHPYWEAYREFALQQGLVACWSNPIFSSKGEVLGSFALYPEERRGPGADELELLDAASHLAAIALERDAHERALRDANERLEFAVRERTRELRAANQKLESEMRVRQEALDALAESEARFRTLVQSIPGVVYRCRLDANWTMLFLSEGAKTVTGYAPELFFEPARLAWSELIHPDDREMVERKVEDAIAARQPFVLEYRLVHRDQSIRWMFERGRAVFNGDEVLYLDGVILDVTRQHEMQDAIRESEQRFRRLADEAPMFVWMTDEKQHCEFCNKAWSEFTGLNQDALLGSGWLEAIHIDSRARMMKELEISGARMAPFHMECTMMRHDGEERIMLIRGAPREPVGSNQSGGFIGSAIDITDMRMAEDESRRRETELAHALRLATVGEMASAVAHELNQPLTSISNYATGAMRRLQHGEITTGDLSNVLREVDELARKGGTIIRRIRSLVQQRTPHRGDSSLVAIIQNAVRILDTEAADSQIELMLELAPGVDAAHVDDVQFEQVLVNLIRNAIEEVREASPVDRSVRIRTKSDPGGVVVVEVEDSGRGMQLNPRDVFQPFRSTKTQGMGLGLSISRSIVEAHGGALTYHPNEPQGARFRIELPPPISGEEDPQS